MAEKTVKPKKKIEAVEVEETAKKDVSETEPSGGVAEKETVTSVKKKKKWKNQVARGRANIQCSYNNTIVTLADMNGSTLAWSSSGHMGFKGAKKSTPYAATQVVSEVVEKSRKYGLQEVEVFVKGVGSGREAAIRALANNGLSLLSIRDITPVAHGGCRSRKARRV